MSATSIVRTCLTRTRYVAAVVFVLALGFCTVAAVMLVQLRNEAWKNSARGAENLLAAVSQDISRNIELFDLSLQAVLEGLRLPGSMALPSDLRQALLFDRAASARDLGAILVLDERGNIVEDAGAVPPRRDNLADRDYFRALRDSNLDGLFISRPFRRRVTGQNDLVIALARRVDRPNGSFGGVVVGTLRLDYFKNLFGRFSLGRQGAVGLFATDGSLLMRLPYNESQIGQNVFGQASLPAPLRQPSGFIHGLSAVDGVSRVTFFSHVGSLPLILTVAVSDADIYAAWNTRALAIGGLLVALCAATAILVVLFSSELRRRGQAEARLRDSESHYRLLADHATDVIIRTGPDLVRRYVSPSSCATLGYKPEDLVGRAVRDLIHPDDWPGIAERAGLAATTQGSFTAAYRIRNKGGHYVWVEASYSSAPGRDGFIVVLRDIGARKKVEAELDLAHAELVRLATTDALTGLGNRRRLDQVLDQEWRRAAREQQSISLLLLDIDMFKSFNDRYGHQAGDRCLAQVASAVAGCARRPPDFAARYGGEEMVLLLPNTEQASAVLVAERLRAAVASLGVENASNSAHGGVTTVSVGIATAIPQHGAGRDAAFRDMADLVSAADQALYEAKRGGRNRVAVFQAIQPCPVLPDPFAPAARTMPLIVSA